ncbi:MAG: Addiction module antitoxin, RelB/DinJ family [Candidatus Levybacteria bacterium GW2011_GWA1_37_16]|nr:hypothetical protein [uncultured bacterium]KKQ26835.1 MAG: Addiction module antitoxin, RelB/DinJ family [Candidatus Levybacteria bacterium GW2011_GWA1_37_16]
MNTAVINIKTDPKVKTDAQKIARQIGVSLSSLINAYLKRFIGTKRVKLDLKEEPSPYLVKMLKKADKDIKAGRVSPGFKTGEEAVAWLEKQGI